MNVDGKYLRHIQDEKNKPCFITNIKTRQNVL